MEAVSDRAPLSPATDVIALPQALGKAEPWTDPSFIDSIVRLQRMREPLEGFADRSPVCTLALRRFLRFTPSALLTSEVDRAVATYSNTVFFGHHRGAVEPTPARRINLADSLVFVADRVTRVEEALSGCHRRTTALPDADR